MPLTLPPAQNAVPAPVISNAPTSGFSPHVLIIVRSAGVRLSDNALRTSGRFSVITATRSRIVQSSSPVPVSIWVSVIFPHSLLLSFRDGPKDQTRNLEIRARCFASPRNVGALELLH